MRVASIAGFTLVAALAIAVSVSGCGSSSSTTTTETTAAITKAEFVVKGNAICIKGEKAQEAGINAYVKKHGLENKKPTKAEQAEMVETVFAPSIQSQIDAVTALGAPSGEEPQVNSALEASEQALSKVKANPGLAFFAKESPFHAAGQQLHALGLTKCAKNA
jgi:hypothetical protein